MRRAALALSATLLSLACTDGFFFEPPESGDGWALSLSLTTLPQFSTVGLQSAYDKSDQARITMHRLDGEQVMDTIVDFDPSNGEVAVDRPADIADGGERFDLVGELYSSSEMLFQGTTQVEIDATRGTPVELSLAPIAVDIDAPESVLFDALADTLHVPVVGFFSTGDSIDDVPVEWTVVDPSVVVATSEGDLRSMSPGTTTAFARNGEAEDTVEVTVAPVVASVEVNPDRVALNPEGEAVFDAIARDRNGNALERDVVWSVDDERVAVISSAGVLVARTEGTTTVTGDVDGIVGTAFVEVTTDAPVIASVTVEPNPAEILLGYPEALRAVVRDASGSQLTDRTVVWSSSSSAFATVSADGTVTGVNAGVATITAIVEGVVGSAQVTVRAPAVSFVGVTPTSLSILEGESTSLELTVLDERGGELTDRVAAWSSSAPSVAQVTSDGVVQGVTAGDAVISVTVEGRTASVNVAVSQRPIASVSIEPSTAEILLGDEVTFTPVVRDSDGNELTGREVAWSSSESTIVSITSEGVATGVALGEVTVTATAEGVSGTATVTVSERPVASVTLDPESADVFVDETVDFSAAALDDSGAVLPGRVIAWTTSDASVVTVSATGAATGVAPGEATITATVEGKSASAIVAVSERPVASVTVAPASAEIIVGDETTLTATARDADGNVLTGRSVVWSSSASGVASVDGSGTVTGVSEGSATIAATVDGVEGTATIAVKPVPVVTVDIAPSSAEINIGDEVTFTATARDGDGNALIGRTVAWSSSASSVASVDGSGVVTGQSAGAASITATVEGVEATATVVVTPVPVATVEIAPLSADIFVGEDVALTATVRDADGNVLTGRAVGWSTSATTVATVTGSGIVTGRGEGTATITATSEGKSATATITVSLVPVASVTVTPATAEVIVGDDAVLSAIVRDADGNVLTGRTVTWSSDAPATASVSDGTVTGVAAGTAKITATVDGIEGSATVTVIPVPVETVEVSPATANITVGDEVTLTAIARDAEGNVLTGRTVTWASDALATATVTAGVVTGAGVGTAKITATVDDVEGSATVTVIPVPVASVEVDPSSAEVVEGDEVTLSAILRAADESVLTGRTVEWSSSNTSVATVSSTGTVTGVTPGTVTITATSEGQEGTASVEVLPLPYPGEDVVVFNDVNIFETITGFPLSSNNRTLVANLVNYTTSGSRNSGSQVWFDFGRNSGCGGECSLFNQRDTRSTIEDAGYTIADISSESGSITEIPADVKVVFLWLPKVSYTPVEINTFKQFAQEGGRIVFVGEHEGVYGATGIEVENDFLAQMGATLINSGGNVDCAGDDGRITLPATSIRAHQITDGMDGLQLSCASEIEPGPGDYSIIWDSSNTRVLVGVARIDTTPLPLP